MSAPTRVPPAQLDLFAPAPVTTPASTPAPRGPLDGLIIRADRPCRRCGSFLQTIVDTNVGPHAALLRCTQCGHFSKWLPKTACEFLREVIVRFGRPTDPINIFENTPRAASAHSGRVIPHPHRALETR